MIHDLVIFVNRINRNRSFFLNRTEYLRHVSYLLFKTRTNQLMYRWTEKKWQKIKRNHMQSWQFHFSDMN